MLRFIFTLAVTLIIPAIGVGIAQLVLEDIGGGLNAEAVCAAAPQEGCARVAGAALLRDVSLGAAAASILLMLAFVALARIAGDSRRLNARIFPRVAPLAKLTVTALVLAHGAILTYAVYIVQAQFAGQVEWIFVALLGGGALAAGLSVVWTVIAATQSRAQEALARPVARAEAPALWTFVEELAAELDAQPPRNLVVGLEPNFFATAAPIATPGVDEPLTGETLYLSLPLMRLFTRGELRAVVGHELGHFRGDDTAYSLRFAPVYRTLTRALAALTGRDGRALSLAAAPAAAILRFLLETFARNERRISRKREHAADAAGVAVSSARNLGVSLAKVAVYAPLWAAIRGDNLNRLTAGKVSRNLSRVYADSARFDVGRAEIGEILTQVLETRIPHPTDTHPPISDRYAAVGFDPALLTHEALARQGLSSEALFKDLVAVEEALTIIEHNEMITRGHADAPQPADEEDGLLNAAYLLAATMVAADGLIAPDEVRIAEGIGGQMFEDFDPVSFREYFDHLDELASFADVASVLGQILSREQKEMIHAYLSEIAAVDAHISPEERALLRQAEALWDVPPRPTARAGVEA